MKITQVPIGKSGLKKSARKPVAPPVIDLGPARPDRQTADAKPTSERLAKAHKDVEHVVTADQKLTLRLLDGSVLDLLLSRGSISSDQYAAGARFYSDWYAAGYANSGVVDPTQEHVDGGGSKEVTERALDAATRWRKAMQGVGVITSNVLVELLLQETRLVDYGRRHHQRGDEQGLRIAAIADLVTALRALDFYYYGRRIAPKSLHHGTDDYRPGIPPSKKGS